MLSIIKCIIYRMVEFAKHWGVYFFSAFIALVIGIVQALIFLTNPTPIIIILVILAIICLIATIIALYYDLRDAYRKDHHLYRGN